MNPDEYDKEFANVKKATQLAPDDKRKTYKLRGARGAQTQQFSLSDVLDHRRTTYQINRKKS